MGVELAGGGGNCTANQLAGLDKMGESPAGRARERTLTRIHVTALTVPGLKGNPFLFPPGVVSTLPRRPGVYSADCLAAAQQQTHDTLVR